MGHLSVSDRSLRGRPARLVLLVILFLSSTAKGQNISTNDTASISPIRGLHPSCAHNCLTELLLPNPNLPLLPRPFPPPQHNLLLSKILPSQTHNESPQHHRHPLPRHFPQPLLRLSRPNHHLRHYIFPLRHSPSRLPAPHAPLRPLGPREVRANENR
ncbi:hypothetical protein QBC32DRAFT_330586 [Pseudoneurospora amorphoporcata]|uniref:Uncharacterized protein n=1 Tax=Pseudoneurospora amorphoporcata TaxID=241081 RepID=A0AAN6SJI6_9PEZI|nr:hypothetical protein QBC32DRAFT_330586 [Pseudoneurospora amorphoporcata]